MSLYLDRSNKKIRNHSAKPTFVQSSFDNRPISNKMESDISQSPVRKMRKHQIIRQIEVENENESLLKNLLSIAGRKNMHILRPFPQIKKSKTNRTRSQIEKTHKHIPFNKILGFREIRTNQNTIKGSPQSQIYNRNRPNTGKSSYQKLRSTRRSTIQDTIDKENCRLLSVIQNTDSRLKNQLQLKNHKKKLKELKYNIGNFTQARNTQQRVKMLIRKRPLTLNKSQHIDQRLNTKLVNKDEYGIQPQQESIDIDINAGLNARLTKPFIRRLKPKKRGKNQVEQSIRENQRFLSGNLRIDNCFQDDSYGNISTSDVSFLRKPKQINFGIRKNIMKRATKEIFNQCFKIEKTQMDTFIKNQATTINICITPTGENIDNSL